MQPNICHTCMFLSIAKEIWDSMFHIYSKVRDAAKMFELKTGPQHRTCMSNCGIGSSKGPNSQESHCHLQLLEEMKEGEIQC